MYRLILSVLLFLAASSQLSAQTIHVLIAADGRAGFGENMVSDYRNMENLFIGNVPKKGLNLIRMDTDAVTPDAILESISNISKIKVAPKDTLVVYYSGHAANDVDSGGHYFQLKDENGKNVELQRRTLLAAMQEKKARLNVLLTDCCNVLQASSGARKEPIRIEKAESPAKISPLFETLFLAADGTVDITSSKKGEASFVDRSSKKRGSCFTYPLVALFEEHRNDPKMTWAKIVDELKNDVQKAFEESWPEGYKIETQLNGSFTQKTQTVYVFGTLPGESAAASQQGPRFGVRAVANSGGGVRVTELFPNGPGVRAGFELGDVILEINDTPINTETEYSDAVDASPKKMTVKIRNVNDGRILNVSFELGY